MLCEPDAPVYVKYYTKIYKVNKQILWHRVKGILTKKESVKVKKTKFEKVKCPTCEKLVDPRGMGAHQRMHVSAGSSHEASEGRTQTVQVGPDDVFMIPVDSYGVVWVSREVIIKLVREWIAGDKLNGTPMA